uniref:Uncharacterized protein n=1 Tax=Arundo donax TaxID=35708 RepID=A0A0A9EYI1_ARUDO
MLKIKSIQRLSFGVHVSGGHHIVLGPQADNSVHMAQNPSTNSYTDESCYT